MKSINGWNDIEAQGNSTTKVLPAGGYVGKITNVTDVSDKEYLKIEWDISEGEFKGNGASCMERNGFMPRAFSFIRSYKDSAIGFFKGFINSVEQSNPGFVWDFKESALVGKSIGVVLGEEEYRKNDGTVGTRLVVKRTISADDVRKGNFRVPDKTPLKEEYKPVSFTPADDPDSDLPF